MKSQYQNYQRQLNGKYSNQEAIVMQTQEVPLTEEVLNQDNRICYKKRREELNRRVQSLLEQKKKVVG
ncbi:hypothetical protein [Rickettsia sp. TH2014]|uniref:hypothetical protein n=1 Tax=Rickettsia sp. TH2014 TaxID=1967503 RepID=UPI001C488EEE|nr:hypothetical protein [Rickettsia sp. TH2014]